MTINTRIRNSKLEEIRWGIRSKRLESGLGSDAELTEHENLAADLLAMAEVLALAIECEMATLEDLRMKASSPKGAIKRHESIVEGLFAKYLGFVRLEDEKLATEGSGPGA